VSAHLRTPRFFQFSRSSVTVLQLHRMQCGQHTHTCLSVLPPRVVLESHTQRALSNVSDMASCSSCATSAGHVVVRDCQKSWPDWATNAGCFMRCCVGATCSPRKANSACSEWGTGGSTRACTPRLRPFGLSLSEYTPSRIRIHHVFFVSVGVVVG
jgi:hypothetical protein